MRRYPRRFRALAAGLAALAGYVDAVGFLTLGGFFVSFMSGNSTRLAVGLAFHTHAAGIAGGLVATFVAGVVAGTLVAGAAGVRRAPVVLGCVAALLAIAALVAQMGSGMAAAFVLAAAMGAENAVFERDGEVAIGLTYMTGTLVKLGQRLAALVRGEDRRGWAGHFVMWVSLTAGAALGASMHQWIGGAAIWLAAALAATLAVVAGAIGPIGPALDPVSRSGRGAAAG
ncbi:MULTISPECIES: YoaK family protein [unclassified Sphingomonas]|jgi:uncharacterized membrane protein YoaK (UPF0700 family)|uniref:YoaK family protein n=1 Tax=unclassified Sphingomonas TaxID=196159 RepID=UPI000E10CA4F|nr:MULTISPECIES: DUF1275 family protein [unclassified Sphingomonas]AXJ94864.1 DUF1275 domain-containing protein [Sphingomonas sp. FARSPH]